MVGEDDWEELAGRPRKGRKSRKKKGHRSKADRLDCLLYTLTLPTKVRV